MTPSKPPIVWPTRTLPFDQLPWDDFERLCLMLLPHEGFENPQHYGAAGGERGRDIVARRNGDLWYVQCKRVKACGPQVLLDEIKKIRGLMEDDPDLRPAGVLFMVSCDVSATARDRAAKRCKELNLACEVWGRTDLDARVQQHSDIVRTFFGWQPTRPIGIPFQAPPLPAHFVPRPEVSDELKTRLLADEPTAPGALVVSAVHGLGGIGKSVLAAALAHDPRVQIFFPTGVLWTTLGQAPDLLSLLSGWVQALGDYDFRPTAVEMASSHLRSLLHDKAALLVVDDAWQADHARAFLVGGERCRVLVTTRDATLARKVGARLYDLDVMTESQALALFEARLGPLDGHREQAAALARELGYLPLALELAAAQVEAGLSWAELLDVFRQALVDLSVLDLDEATYRNESLRLSFSLSLDGLPPDGRGGLSSDDRQAFAWLGVLPEDVRLNPVVAATLWDQPERDARKRLHRLRDKALLKPVGDDRYTIHDLLYDEAKLRMVERMPLSQAHAALLACYKKLTRDGLWHTLPDDGYIHAHLVWHVERAGRVEEIHTLLREETSEGRNAWYEARDALGQITGYLDDVRCVWRLAKEEFATRYSSLAVGLQCRYALVVSSLNSLAKNIPLELLVALVEEDIWRPSQGVAYAQRIPELKQRVDSLRRLAQLPSCVDLHDDLLQKALVIAQAIKDVGYKAEALVGLVPHLSESDRKEALREALIATQAIRDTNSRVEILMRLVPHLSGSERIRILRAVATAIQDVRGAFRAIEHNADEMLEKLGLLVAQLRSPQDALMVIRAMWDRDARLLISALQISYLPIDDLWEVMNADSPPLECC